MASRNEKDTVEKSEAGAGDLGSILYCVGLGSESIGKLFKSLQGVQLILADAGMSWREQAENGIVTKPL